MLAPTVSEPIDQRPLAGVPWWVLGRCTLLTTWTQTFEQLLAMRFVTGLGPGGALPNITALISEYAPPRPVRGGDVPGQSAPACWRLG